MRWFLLWGWMMVAMAPGVFAQSIRLGDPLPGEQNTRTINGVPVLEPLDNSKPLFPAESPAPAYRLDPAPQISATDVRVLQLDAQVRQLRAEVANLRAVMLNYNQYFTNLQAQACQGIKSFMVGIGKDGKPICSDVQMVVTGGTGSNMASCDKPSGGRISHGKQYVRIAGGVRRAYTCINGQLIENQ